MTLNKKCIRCLNGKITDPFKTVCDDCWKWREENPIEL